MTVRLPANVTPSDTLLLRKVPPNANTVGKIFKHFKRFGRIKGIWCCGTEALITFEKDEDCRAAFESPEAYANNRFVRFLYPTDAEHAESKLSQFADLERVMAVVEEVRGEIAKAAKESIILRSNMQAQQKQDQDDGMRAQLEEMVRSCEARRDEFSKKLKQLKQELEADPESPTLALEIEEIEGQIKQCEETITEIRQMANQM